jgi:hypothetical protein
VAVEEIFRKREGKYRYVQYATDEGDFVVIDTPDRKYISYSIIPAEIWESRNIEERIKDCYDNREELKHPLCPYTRDHYDFFLYNSNMDYNLASKYDHTTLYMDEEYHFFNPRILNEPHKISNTPSFLSCLELDPHELFLNEDLSHLFSYISIYGQYWGAMTNPFLLQRPNGKVIAGPWYFDGSHYDEVLFKEWAEQNERIEKICSYNKRMAAVCPLTEEETQKLYHYSVDYQRKITEYRFNGNGAGFGSTPKVHELAAEIDILQDVYQDLYAHCSYETQVNKFIESVDIPVFFEISHKLVTKEQFFKRQEERKIL